jgi:hypothetical protein
MEGRKGERSAESAIPKVHVKHFAMDELVGYRPALPVLSAVEWSWELSTFGAPLREPKSHLR